MQDIRESIDTIDQEIISLIGKRAEYVHEAAKFKTDADSVKATDRVQKMMIQRRKWAEASQLDPDFIEQLYQNLVDYFVQKEMKTWKDQSASS